MTVSRFKGGLKLPERKYATEGKAVELAPMPKKVVIPINQHIGAPNKSLVNVGDMVIRGQKIADGAEPGLMTVPVHASLTGKVVKIELRTLSNNSEGLCIVIEEAEALEAERFYPPLDPYSCTKEEALQRIREAGIIGMGGAGFPSHVKLSPPPGKALDYIIANGAECEPYLTTDEADMAGRSNLMLKGLSIIMKITGVKKALIGIEKNKEKLVPVIEQELRLADLPGEISVCLCRTRYPQGSEKMLITALTGRKVPAGGLPMDAGCIVQNIASLIAIAEAFYQGKPLIERDLTVSGRACKTPKNIRAQIGSSLADMPVEFMDIDQDRLTRILFGGPMMGTAVSSLDTPIQKNTSGIILMTKEETAVFAEGPCICCGRCTRSCPCRLSPVIMNNSIEADDLDYSVKAGLLDCIECGSCSYVCPARIKLVHRFRAGKQLLKMRPNK